MNNESSTFFQALKEPRTTEQRPRYILYKNEKVKSFVKKYRRLFTIFLITFIILCIKTLSSITICSYFEACFMQCSRIWNLFLKYCRKIKGKLKDIVIYTNFQWPNLSKCVFFIQIMIKTINLAFSLLWFINSPNEMFTLFDCKMSAWMSSMFKCSSSALRCKQYEEKYTL